MMQNQLNTLRNVFITCCKNDIFSCFLLFHDLSDLYFFLVLHLLFGTNFLIM